VRVYVSLSSMNEGTALAAGDGVAQCGLHEAATTLQKKLLPELRHRVVLEFEEPGMFVAHRNLNY
jgi:hypothetical protein